MKPKRSALVLALLLCILLLPGLAEDQDIELSGQMPVLLDNTWYMTDTARDGSARLMAYTLGDEAPRLISSLPPVPQNIPWDTAYEDYPEEIKQALHQVVSALAVKDGQLLAINHYTGRIGSLTNQGVTWTDRSLDNSRYFKNAHLAAYLPGFSQDNHYIVATRDYNQELDLETLSLLISDLETGQTLVLDSPNLVSVQPHSPGKLLALQVDTTGQSPAWQLALLDVQTGTTSPLPFTLPEFSAQGASPLGAITYDAAQDRYFIATKDKLLLAKDKGSFEPTALLDFNHMDPSYSQGFPLKDGRLAVWFAGNLAIRQVGSPVDMGKTLSIKGGFMGFGIKGLFKKQAPDITLFADENNLSAAEAGQTVRNGDTETDLFVLAADPGLHALITKGYAAPLTDPALLSDLAAMYPAVQEVVQNQEGQPCGFPIIFKMLSATIQREAWQQYFPDIPYPSTYLELFQHMLDFNSRYASTDPEAYFLFDTTEENLLNTVIAAYIRQYESPGEPLDFSRPILKETLDTMTQALAVARAAGQGPQEFVGETSGDIRNAPSLVSLMGSSNPFSLPNSFGLHDDLLPALTFQKGEERKQAASLRVMVINPNSAKKDLAQRFLRLYLDPASDLNSYYALRPGANTPYPNPNYEEAVLRTKADLEHYTKALEEAQNSSTATSEEKRIYQFRIDLALQDLKEQDRLKYLIHQEGIDRFRLLAPSLRYFTTSRLLDQGPAQEQLVTLMQRYLSGSPLEVFLKDLSDMARQVFGESR